MSSVNVNDIDPEIRELLFANYLMSIKTIKDIIEKINTNPDFDKTTLIKMLYENLRSTVAEDKSNPALLDNLCNKAKKHIRDWEKEISTPQLKDIFKMAKHIHLPVMQILDHSFVTPSTIKDAIDDYVVGQDEYLEKLSLSFYLHYLRVFVPGVEDDDYPRSNLLVYGPTGVGKTFAVQVLGELFGLNVGMINCNILVQSGIVGQSITDVFTEIYNKSNGSVKAVENAIVFFDEYDKLLYQGSYNERVVNEILSIIDDEGSVFFNTKHGNKEYESLRAPTKNMLFIFSGVFDGLKNVIKRKHNTTSIGYTRVAPKNLSNFYDYVETEDFRLLGLRDEMLGRIRDFAYVKELSSEVIEDIIMRSENSPIIPFRNYFDHHGISLNVEEDAVEILSDYVVEKKLGARGIKSLLWRILSEEMSLVSNTGKKMLKDIHLDKNFVNKKLNKRK